MKNFRAALLQMRVSESKEDNLSRAAAMVGEAAAKGADLVVLPEMFNCPYQTELFPRYAEVEGGTSWQRLSQLAAAHKIILVGGSMPERDRDGRIYNTCFVFDQSGRAIAKHRKMHLFDIAVRNGQHFKESDTLSAGNKAVVFPTSFGVIGVMVCFDLRFPELARLLVDRGAEVVIVPGAFNMTTGPAHWELLFRARALDNQCWFLGAAPARDASAGYVSYGHSLATDPWGDVIGHLDEQEGILLVDIDRERTAAIRDQLPLLHHRRRDVYRLHLTDDDAV